MPVYTYHCEECDHQFEKYQSFSEEALSTCPNCKKNALLKVYKPAQVVFKGKGFYVTDNKTSKATLSSGANKENGKSEGKKKPAGEAKSEKTPEKKAKSPEK